MKARIKAIQILAVILLCLLSLDTAAQLKPPSRRNINSRPLVERKKTQTNRVYTVIAVNIAVFAVGEYAIRTENVELRQACIGTFFTTNIIGAAWVLSLDTHTDKRPFKTRIKQNFRFAHKY